MKRNVKNLPLLLVYFFEPSLIACDDSDTRHWRFVYEIAFRHAGKA